MNHQSTRYGLSHPSHRQAEICRDLLSLVLEKPPAVCTIQKWNAGEYLAAEEWAVCSHLSASDNPVRVPRKPAVLDRYR